MLKQRDPAVQTMFHELRMRIERGRYQPGTWLPTERDLAAEFSVQRAVVRAALASLAERDLIVRQPGRRPWVNERQPQTPPTEFRRNPARQLQVIAAVLPQHTKFASSITVLSGINRALRQEEAPYRLIAFDNYGEAPIINIEEERAALRSALADGVAGIILWSMDVRQTLPEIQLLRDNNVPVVFIDRYAPGWDGDFVGIDNRGAARQAVNYLLDLGHRRIGFIAGDEGEYTTTTRDRGLGYRETLQRRGLAAPELVYLISPDNDPNVHPVDYFLQLQDPPTAIFANNDAIAYWFIRDLEARGVRVPQDVSVIGFDDTDRFSPRPPRLTTIQQPFEEMGRAATELLLRRLQPGESARFPWQHVLLPTPLIVRETCCSPRQD